MRKPPSPANTAARHATDAATASSLLLTEVTRLYVRAQRTAADCCGTTPTQGQLMAELARSGPMALGELARRLLLEKSWLGRAVDALVTEGLLSKSPHPSDSRSSLVQLTRAGQRRNAALSQQIEDHAARVLGQLAPADQLMVDRALALLLQALRGDAGIAAPCCVSADDQQVSTSTPASTPAPAPAPAPASPQAGARAATTLSTTLPRPRRLRAARRVPSP